MPQQIILRKGTAADWTSANPVLAAGEPGVETDTGKFKIGDGSTAWTLLDYAVPTVPTDISDLSDTTNLIPTILSDLSNVSSSAPSTGQVLKWDGAQWAPGTDSTGTGGGAATLNELTDVDTAGVVDGDVLTYNTGVWVASPAASIPLTLDDLSDVDSASAVSGNIIRYNGTSWIAGAADLNTTLSDVNIDNLTLAAGNFLTYTADDFWTNVPLNSFASVIANTTPITAEGVTGGLQLLGGTGITVTGDDVAKTITLELNGDALTFTGTTNVEIMRVNDVIEPPSGFPLRVNGGLQVGNDTVSGLIYSIHSTYSPFWYKGWVFAQHHETPDVMNFNFYRTRGTSAIPATIQSGDKLGEIGFYGWNGVTQMPGAAITVDTTAAPGATNVPTRIRVATNNGSGIAYRAEFASSGEFKVDNITALTTNSNLTLSGNGTGVVSLPAGSTVGGIPIGSIQIQGSVADFASLPGTSTIGYLYVTADNGHGYVWDGAAWIDVGQIQGPQGIQGLQGVDGNAATLQVGTVTTGAPGSSATVTNVGTATEAVFDFAIPQGTAGTDGAAGADGLGFTGGSYNGATGIVTFTSDDGLGFSTEDLRGADGAPGTPGADGAAGADGADGIGVPAGGTGGQVLAKIDGTDYNTQWVNQSGGIALTDLSVTTATAGTASLSYDNSLGVFTYTPPDLTGYASSSSVPINLADLADVSATSPSTGQVLKWDGAAWSPATDATGGGGSMGSRTTVNGSSASLVDGGTGPINIVGYSSYMLMKVQTSAAAWVRIYTSEAARIADAGRAEGTDPTPGSGVIAEVITTGAETILITPGALGFNDEGPVTTNIPIRVTNKSGGTTAIAVTLTVLQLEA
jgi:hypothetical protein